MKSWRGEWDWWTYYYSAVEVVHDHIYFPKFKQYALFKVNFCKLSPKLDNLKCESGIINYTLCLLCQYRAAPSTWSSSQSRWEDQNTIVGREKIKEGQETSCMSEELSTICRREPGHHFNTGMISQNLWHNFSVIKAGDNTYLRPKRWLPTLQIPRYVIPHRDERLKGH